MQIEVIDNCSTIGDPEAVVREMGGGRIAFHRQTAECRHRRELQRLHRAGRAATGSISSMATTRCGRVSTTRLRSGITAHPEVARGALPDHLHGRRRPVDGADRARKPRAPGVLDEDFARRQFLEQRIQFAAMVVRRVGLRGTRRLPGPRSAIAWIGTCGSASPCASRSTTTPSRWPATGCMPPPTAAASCEPARTSSTSDAPSRFPAPTSRPSRRRWCGGLPSKAAGLRAARRARHFWKRDRASVAQPRRGSQGSVEADALHVLVVRTAERSRLMPVTRSRAPFVATSARWSTAEPAKTVALGGVQP